MEFLNGIDKFLNNKKLIKYFSIALAVFVVGIGFLDIVLDNDYNSDYVENVLWAEALLKSGRLLNPDFYYDYTVPFGGNILMAPFVALFGLGLTANKCGMTVFFIIYLLAIYSFASSICEDNRKFLIIAISTMFIYTKAGQNFLHHIIYYGPAFVCLIGGIGSVINILKNKNIKLNLTTLCIWSFWGSANGFGQFALCNASLLFSIIVIFYISIKENKKVNNKYIGIAVVILLSSAIGFLINKIVNRGIITTGYMDENYMLTSMYGMYENMLIKLPEDWFNNFYIFSEGVQLFSFSAIEVLFRISFMILLTSIIILNMINFNKFEINQKLVVVNAVIITILCICEYVMTARYKATNLLFNSIYMLTVLLGVDIVYLFKNKHFKYLLITFLSLAILIFSYTSITQDINTPANVKAIDVLNEKGIHHGYAKHWSSNINTALSKGKIRVASLENDTDDFKTHKSNTWSFHFNKPEEDEFFLLLTNNEYEDCKDSCAQKLSLAKEQIELEDSIIFIYDTEYWNSIVE